MSLLANACSVPPAQSKRSLSNGWLSCTCTSSVVFLEKHARFFPDELMVLLRPRRRTMYFSLVSRAVAACPAPNLVLRYTHCLRPQPPPVAMGSYSTSSCLSCLLNPALGRVVCARPQMWEKKVQEERSRALQSGATKQLSVMDVVVLSERDGGAASGRRPRAMVLKTQGVPGLNKISVRCHCCMLFTNWTATLCGDDGLGAANFCARLAVGSTLHGAACTSTSLCAAC